MPRLSVDSRERELLTGMGNCYEACHDDFDGTVGMVAQTRKRTPEDVKTTLARMRERFHEDRDYRELRDRLPPDFPL